MNKLLAAYHGVRAYFDNRTERKSIALLAVTSPDSIRNASLDVKLGVQRAVSSLLRLNKSHHVHNWYQSGNPYSDGTRSLPPEVLTDARYDQNQITRREAMRRMRYWEQNSPFLKRALDVGEQYVIGTHCPVVTSLATDVEWQVRAENVFLEMCQDAGMSGESLFAMLGVGYRRRRVDGNILFVQTSKPGTVAIRSGTKYETQLPVMKPCYQPVESHRVGTPFSMWQEEGNDIFDGIQYKVIETRLPGGDIVKHKVKAFYWVNDSANVFSVEQGFTKVPVEYAYYAHQCHRVNEPRSMTDFYAAEPTLAKLEDLLALEMKAQIIQSDIAMFITNGSGQAPTTSQQSTLAQLGMKVTLDANTGKPIVTSEDLAKIKLIYEKINGGTKFYGRTGDTAEMMAPNRPAEATLNLWNFVIDSFCGASNIPRILVFPKSQQKSQGTEVRAEIEAANGAFIKEFNLIWKPFIHQVWEYFIGWAVKNDERVKNPPADWRNIEVSHPRSVVVDLGYAAAETISFLEAGLMTLHQVAQQFGTTRQRIIDGSVKDIYDIKLACAKMATMPQYSKYNLTVDAGEVRSNLADAAQALAAGEAGEKESVSSTSES